MQLSVIIVNYNVRAFLENALISVQKAMNGIDGEIIVVDNASDDDSVEMVKQKFPGVRLIANTHNAGFAAANNQGMKESKGSNILLLNPDTLLQEDTLHTMLSFFEQHPDAGLAGCKILNGDGTLQLACRRSFPTPWVALTKIFGLSALFPKSKLFGKYNLEFLDPGSSYPVDAVSGSFMFLRREVYEKTGGLDEQFFMYGEDLDWCYRITQSGWKIWYVSSTQIIHYKGQSAKRSDIDEVKVFYHSMRLFVRKHFRRGVLLEWMLMFGIALREWAAFLGKATRSYRAALFDFLFVAVTLLLGEFIWFGEIFHFPAYGYPVLMTIPGLMIVGFLASAGLYTTRKLSLSRTFSSVIAGYIVLAALTFFFKQYGFSRMMLLLSGVLSLAFLPGWRLIARTMFRSSNSERRSLFGRRTIIVGVDSSGQEVLRKLRARIADGYSVVGFIDSTHKRIGEKIAGVEILGSIDNIGKVIQEYKVSDVIFSAESLSYADILSVIGRNNSRSVNYRFAPSSLEVIIGNTHIDELDDIPLIEIDYKIGKAAHRFAKRLFDIVLSSLLLIVVYPFSLLKSSSRNRNNKVQMLPEILKGRMSFVGPTEHSLLTMKNGSMREYDYLGKPGMTGLVQINDHDTLTQEEIERYNVYYAKNQSLMLDLEILLKSFFDVSQR